MVIESWTWAWGWWGTVVGINVVNLIIGVYIFTKSRGNNGTSSYSRNMKIAGLIFIGVAFYRSIFVSNYLHQLAWFDTLLNSTLLIRSFAFFAELAFAYLIMNLLLAFNKDLPIPEEHKEKKVLYFLETKAPKIFFIFLFLAQFFAYGGAITKVHLLFAIEETFWGLGFLLITPLVLIQSSKLLQLKDDVKRQMNSFKIPLLFLAVFCVGYSIYSVFYHLPIEYWPEAIHQLQVANPDPAFRFGFKAIADTFTVVNVTRDYATWGGLGFVIWHSGYFTLCGWMTLFFMRAPKKNI